jgi:hypothetical protein
MKKVVVISGDIVAYTSLEDTEKTALEKQLKAFFIEMKKEYSVFARIVKGDFIEIVAENAEDALAVVLLVKSFIKSVSFSKNLENNRTKSFKNHGIRIAMGYGELSRYDAKKGIVDGEAIYLSGRKINEETTHNKQRIVIKNTLFFVSTDETLNYNMNTILGLIDVLMSKATSKQCEILYYKLLGLNEDAIADKLKIRQSAVNQHSTNVGWNAIERAVKYFNFTFKEMKV